MDSTTVLILTTFFAAIVNGGLGYGFSSLTVPVALLFYTNRLLNPAMVLIEVGVNLYVLLMNRKNWRVLFKRVSPILIGLPFGVIVGSATLSSVRPEWIKLVTYILLLPLILIQAAGIRRPLQDERRFGVPFGLGLGVLYAITTISGPPLALLFNNQGLVKHEFRAALGIVRTAESSMTALAYGYLGLYSSESLSLLYTVFPSVLIGMPIGFYLIRKMNAETFRRICMTLDVWVVGWGLSRVLIGFGWIAPIAYSVMIGALLIDTHLLYRFFSSRKFQEVPKLPMEQTS